MLRSTCVRATSGPCYIARGPGYVRLWSSPAVSQTFEHISCQEVVELVTDYLEGAMAPDEVARFEHHLSLCEGCVLYVEQIRMTIAAVGRVREDDVPPELRDELVAAFRDFRRSV